MGSITKPVTVRCDKPASTARLMLGLPRAHGTNKALSPLSEKNKKIYFFCSTKCISSLSTITEPKQEKRRQANE